MSPVGTSSINYAIIFFFALFCFVYATHTWLQKTAQSKPLSAERKLIKRTHMKGKNLVAKFNLKAKLFESLFWEFNALSEVSGIGKATELQ